ncbi:MAG: ribonucleotide-diphosphate reductase subunit beta [Actinomycetota bacterium]|nr:ribonucleotide-diphosphate reductase subunit beta [Actinomycetota bacterium]
MAETLEQLAQQGDPGTLASEEQASKIQLLRPQQLYELWEKQHWQTQELDFEQDRRDWANLTEEEREYFVWGLSAFFIGEERVTTQFSGLVMAYEDESEEAFLATQQVDEARHTQFFDRFYREVIEIEGDTWEQRLSRVREEVNDAFVTLFDEALVEANQRLIASPKDLAAKVDFCTTYHMVIEGCLALTGQNFISSYLERNNLLPGFVDGFKKVARDEHRHVAYGTWFLKEKCGEDDAMAQRMRARLQELLPVASGVLVPPGADPNDWEMLGYTSAEVNEFAFNALSRRLKAIGVPMFVEADGQAALGSEAEDAAPDEVPA